MLDAILHISSILKAIFYLKAAAPCRPLLDIIWQYLLPSLLAINILVLQYFNGTLTFGMYQYVSAK